MAPRFVGCFEKLMRAFFITKIFNYMKNSLLYCLLALIGMGLLTSCGKDEEVTTVEDRIVGTWQISDRTIAPGLPGTGNDAFTSFEDCEKDDLHVFENGNVLKVDNGAMKCDPAAGQTETGSYAFSVDLSTLTTSMNGVSQDWSVSEVNETSLILIEKVTFDNREYEYTYTYVKQ